MLRLQSMFSTSPLSNRIRFLIAVIHKPHKRSRSITQPRDPTSNINTAAKVFISNHPLPTVSHHLKVQTPISPSPSKSRSPTNPFQNQNHFISKPQLTHNALHNHPRHPRHPPDHCLRRPGSLRHLSSWLCRGRDRVLCRRWRCLGSDRWPWSTAGNFGL